jgi:hypothetical protein
MGISTVNGSAFWPEPLPPPLARDRIKKPTNKKAKLCELV